VINSVSIVPDFFQRVKTISFPEVIRVFYDEEPRRSKIHCPFHEEKTPSFHIYENGFFCFSCGEKGDSIDFIVKLYNLRPINAAKLIAERFGLPVSNGPLSRQDMLRLARAKAERLREKRLKEAFDNWARLAGQQVRILAEAIRLQLEEKGLDIEEDLLPLVHELPRLEWWANILAEGTGEEKLELFRNKDFRRWFTCKN
jgi:DNA primase